MEATDVWDHFDKCINDDGEKKAKCRICEHLYNILDINNLKKHLETHEIYVSDKPAERLSKFEVNVNKCRLWEFFIRADVDNRKAVCKECRKALSYKSTIGNLKKHLRTAHPESYEKLTDLKNSEFEEEIVQYEVLEEVGTDEDDSGTEAAGGVWSYFERDGRRARCVVCRVAVTPRAGALALHLREHHPKLLAVEESDQQEDDSGHYTEVVYLEDSVESGQRRSGERHNARSRNKRRRSEYVEPKRRSSPVEKDSIEIRRKNPEDEEIESFGVYITCLLKSLPKDVCSAVQRDIVNIIMTAKLSKTVSSQSVLMDSAPVILKSVAQNKSFIVIEGKAGVDAKESDDTQPQENENGR